VRRRFDLTSPARKTASKNDVSNIPATTWQPIQNSQVGESPSRCGRPLPYPTARSNLVFMFLKRFLDMFQNRVRICRRHVGRVAARVRWPRTDMAAIPRKHGSEFGLDAIPVSIVHRRPSRKITDQRPGYGSPGAQMKKAGLVVNNLGTARVHSQPRVK
jgi:hypothetical protein